MGAAFARRRRREGCLAVTETQISAWRLPTRPTKSSDSRAKSFGEVSVELDAISPASMRALVKSALEDHISDHELDVLKIVEESERQQLLMFAKEQRA